MLEKTHQHYLKSLNKCNNNNVFYTQEISTLLGNILSIADDTFLYACIYINDLTVKTIEKLLKTYSAKIVFKSNQITQLAKLQLDKYFKKELKDFSIRLQLTGTDFQKQVWQELCKIPYGKTMSYLQQAKNINKPTAFRAVANANGKNLFPIIIPCHRVVASNGKLGGYTGGLDKKEFLLSLER